MILGTAHLTDDQINFMVSENVNNDLSADDLQNEISAVINNNKYVPLTQCIRCSAHTLQLCIENGLKLEAISKFITKARKVIHILYIIHFTLFIKT